MKTQPGGRRAYPDIPACHTELRETVDGLGYVLSINEDIWDTEEGWPESTVAVWIDRAMTGGPEDARPAVGVIRLALPEAIRVAEQILAAAERLPEERD